MISSNDWLSFIIVSSIFFCLVAAAAPANGDGCTEYTSCLECGKAEGCGWCPSRQSCEAGNEFGSQSELCPDWDLGCGSCALQSNCSSCTKLSGCQWCVDTQSCVGEDDSCDNFERVCSDEDPCSSAKSCWDCSQQQGCGWCKSTKTCLAGNLNSPENGGCSGWMYTCRSTCRSRTTCGECVMDRGCGWCFNTDRCVNRVDYEYEIYAGDECADSTYYERLCPNECPGYSDCESCTADYSCEWCISKGECIPKAKFTPYYDIPPLCEDVASLQIDCPRFDNFNKLRCNSYFCPRFAVGKPDTRCTNSIEDCECALGYILNKEEEKCEPCDSFECPMNSVPEQTRRCIRDINDCQCNIGAKADRKKQTCELCDTFTCPLNSKPKLDKQCIRGFNDCECNFGYRRQNDACLNCTTYECPLYAEPEPGRNCIEKFRDCSCKDGFKKNNRDELCEPCDTFQCPEFSERREGVGCVKDFGDCTCKPGTIRQKSSCMNCFEYVGRGWCGNVKDTEIVDTTPLAPEAVTLDECKELCLQSAVCKAFLFSGDHGIYKGNCEAVFETPTMIDSEISSSCYRNLCVGEVKK